MSSVRRQGVIDEFGSLSAYRAHVLAGREECAARLRAAVNCPDEAPSLVWQLADWDLDLEWINAELARENTSDRRQHIIDELGGSLPAYREYVIRGRDECATAIAVVRETQPEPGPLHVMQLMLADWEADLVWIDAELAREAA
jgi:hypothetical protein